MKIDNLSHHPEEKRDKMLSILPHENQWQVSVFYCGAARRAPVADYGLAHIKIIDSAQHCCISVIRKDISINPSVMISGQDGGQPSQFTKPALRVAGVDKSH